MSRTLEIFEHERLRVAEVGDGIREHEFDALVRFNDHHGGRYFDVGHRHLKAKQFVGYLEVGDVAIEILPKADKTSPTSSQVWRSGLLEMLRVALGLRLQRLPDAAQSVSRSRLLDLIAQAYIGELEPLLHEGLAKGYRSVESNGAVFLGRLKVNDHLRTNLARADRFFVEYQSFDHDIPINRALLAAVEALSWCALSPSVASKVEELLARFPLVRLTTVDPHAFDRIVLTRATRRYERALLYAQMILAHQGPRLRSGDNRVFALLFDMNALWERYIAVLFRRAAPAGVLVQTQERHRFWLPHGHAARRVRPDIVVRTTAGGVILVIDTKWKVPSTGLPSDSDLQQMFVYNELLEAGHSILLYPRASSLADSGGPFAVKGHECEQRHVGVLFGATWSTEAIKEQLAALLPPQWTRARP